MFKQQRVQQQHVQVDLSVFGEMNKRAHPIPQGIHLRQRDGS